MTDLIQTLENKEMIPMTDVYPMYHGSPYDRGGADAWYARPKNPHKYPNGTYRSDPVILTDPEEIKAYMAGYSEGIYSGKQWT